MLQVKRGGAILFLRGILTVFLVILPFSVHASIQQMPTLYHVLCLALEIQKSIYSPCS